MMIRNGQRHLFAVLKTAQKGTPLLTVLRHQLQPHVLGQTAAGRHDIDSRHPIEQLYVKLLSGSDVVDFDVLRAGGSFAPPSFQTGKQGKGQEHRQKGKHGKSVKSRTDGKTDAGSGPKSRGGGQTLDL